MIIARSPLRITLGGGGTDLPSYYREHEGFVISAAIDKYVYVSVTRPFSEGFFLKYSELEKAKRLDDIRHPIIREVLNMINFSQSKIEIVSVADIPAGTGLGSSGSFTTALIKAIYIHQQCNIHPEELARLACEVEIDRLGEPIGKQDQYIAAHGGITCFTFHANDDVTAKPLAISSQTLLGLEDNLLLFFTGFSRSAGSILKDQKTKSQEMNIDMLRNLEFIKDLGLKSQDALLKGDLIHFANLMNHHWEYKKRRSSGMSNSKIDEWYELAMQNGAIGGKVVGAGGGGFLMFYASDRDKLRKKMAQCGLEEVRFGFDFEGTKIVLS